MVGFKTGQLVRANVSGRYFRVVGLMRNHGRWTLQEIGKGRVYTARTVAAMSFSLIGNNYKAKE